MSENNNVLISLTTSLIASNITFILGLKAGKNQSDRQTVREKYKKLYKHFNELLFKINTNHPKQWSDFKSIKINENTSKFIPIVDINKKNIKKMKNLEQIILKYAGDYKEYCNILKDIFIDKLKECNYDNKCKKTLGLSYREINIGVFMLEDEFTEMIKDIDNKKIDGVAFYLQNGRQKVIYDFFKNMNLSDFLKEFHKEIKRSEESIKLLKIKIELINKINNINKYLIKKIKEPFSFWETVLGAFVDIFRI